MTDENLLKTHCLDALEKKLNRTLFNSERENLDIICNLLPLYYHSRTGDPLYPEANADFDRRRFALNWFLPEMVTNSFSIAFGDYTPTHYLIKTPHENKEVWQQLYLSIEKTKELEPVFLSGLYKAYTDFFLDPDYEPKPQRNHHK